jgi:hypothetical protein
MIVWGVGTHTLRLLATGGFDVARIALFLDSNPRYQHQRLRGVPIVALDEFDNPDGTNSDPSRSSEQAIQDQIRSALGLTNLLTLLYGEAGNCRVETSPVLDTLPAGGTSLE